MMIEPWMLAIVLLIAVPLDMLIGAVLSRRNVRRVLAMSGELLKDPSLTRADRLQVRNLMGEALSRWPTMLVAVTAPLWCLPLALTALNDALRHETEEELLADARKRMDELAALDDRIAAIVRERRMDHSPTYKARRYELEDAAFGAALQTSPLLTSWIFLWAAPAFAIYTATGVAGAAVSRFRVALDSFVHLTFKRIAH